MAEPFVGQICPFGFNFAPFGYATCDGQLLAISQYTALFSLLGTTYGGNGQTTFALPDLRGRAPMHMGSGPGLSTYVLGQQGGEETHTLIQTEIPQHTHILNASSALSDSHDPNGCVLATSLATGTKTYLSGTSPNVGMNPQTIGNTGGSQPHSNLQPFLVVTFCIATDGIYPSRN